MKQLNIGLLALAVTVIVALTSACASAPPPAPSLSSRQPEYTVVNLGPDFEKFWSLAAGKSFAEQLEIWNRVVERPHQAFYDGMVWQKSENPKWEERKIRRLKEYFPKYQRLHDGMKIEFEQFDGILKTQIQRFVQFFPDAHFDLPIYAAPTTTFNGKGGEGGDSGDPLGKTVLAFGIDMIVERKDNPDVLYSHELFHIYHTAAAGVNEKVFLKEGKLTLPLWLEGLATYVSQQMNPRAPLADVLMAKDLPLVTDGQIRLLAKKFLAESGEKAFDSAKPEIYKKWFAIEPQFSLGAGLPQRCGYVLGLRVSERLARKYQLRDMVHWGVGEAHRRVLGALREIAAGG